MSDTNKVLIRKDRIDFVFLYGTEISSNGVSYYHANEWFLVNKEEESKFAEVISEKDLPTWVKEMIPLQSKDQQIKELTGLIKLCVDRLSDNDPYFTKFMSENEELQEYF